MADTPASGRFDFLHSIRFRLAAWFVLVLALVLLIFSLFVYYSEAHAVRVESELRLNARLMLANGYLRGILSESVEQGRLPLTNGEHGPQFSLESGEVMVLTGSNGQVVAAWGPVSAARAAELAGLASQTSADFTTLIDPFASGQPVATLAATPLAGVGQVTVPPLSSGAVSASSTPARPQTYLFSRSRLEFEGHVLGGLILGQPLDPQGQLPRLRLTLGLAALITLAAAMAGGYWLADRTLRPVKAITRTAQEISGSDLSRRLNLRSRDELGQLAATFDRMLDRLQAAFARQRQFTADASHELRTPLTIVELETSRSLGGERSSQEYRQSLQVIRSENEMMTRLVNELLTLARMDAGQIRLNAETLDLSDLALDVAERYAPLAARTGVEVQVGELAELPVRGDRQYLTQMAGNLVDNAIKYGSAPADSQDRPPDRPRVSLSTFACTQADQDYACLRVSDNGAGIPPEHLPHVFDRFYRVDQVRSRNEQEPDGENASGSGLGLSIVQWIAHAHGGYVTVESKPGQGTSFDILLPLTS